MPKKWIQITGQPEMWKLKRGGWAVRYRVPAHDGEPERKSKVRKYPEAKTKNEARRMAEEYREELENEINDYTTREDITFGEYARRWHDNREDGDEINHLTWKREELLIRKLEESKLAKIKLNEVAEEDVEAYKKEMAKYSKSEQHRLVGQAKQILRHATKHRRIRYNPAELVKDVKVEKKQRRPLTIEEQQALLKALHEEKPDGYRAVLMIALGTGMRRGEVLGLLWSDLDLKKKTLTIDRQLNADGEIKAPKYNGRGVIPLDDLTFLWLTKWRTEVIDRVNEQVKDKYWGQDRQHRKRNPGREVIKRETIEGLNNTPICCNRKLGHIDPNVFSRWFRKYFVDHGWATFEKVERRPDKNGVMRIHREGYNGPLFHELRHTMATELAGGGADIQTIKTVMRHTNITTTEKYLHEIPEVISQAMEKRATRLREYDGKAELAEERTYTTIEGEQVKKRVDQLSPFAG